MEWQVTHLANFSENGNRKCYHWMSFIVTLALAIAGGVLVGVSRCPQFCPSNPLFISGFVLLMIMIVVVLQWLIIALHH